MIFIHRKLAVSNSIKERLHMQEALAAEGIASFSRVQGIARELERRNRLGGLSREEAFHTIYVHKNDYDKAAQLLQSLRRGG